MEEVERKIHFLKSSKVIVAYVARKVIRLPTDGRILIME
jgi:hypothetical protein